MNNVESLMDIFFEALYLILIIGCLVTWIPRLPVHKPPLSYLVGFCDVIFAPFRKIIPPVGGLDLSPILAFIFLGLARQVVVEILLRI